MKTKFYFLVMLAVSIMNAYAQKSSSSTIDSLKNFNSAYWLSYSSRLNLSETEQSEFLRAQQRRFILDTYFPAQKLKPQPPTIQQSCTNIDFESGNLNGWTASTGFHPLFNASGCCPTAGGSQTILNAGNDPCGGFPVVSPGGNFSLRLGNNGTGGIADRIEQTFSVTAANANFTYKYAVVFQDPGHTTNEQPSFQVEMFDSSNTAIPCTYYNVAAGQGIAGFLNSNCAGVIYKPWTNVVVDLTNYIGQNVTIRFTTYDCALGGHYGYAYIDGSCLQFQQTTSDTICAGTSKLICGPTGFGSYVWNGPGVVNAPGQCVNVSAQGVYTVQTTLVTGCQGPEFYFPILHYPKPLSSYNTSGGNCIPTVNFNNTSSVASGSIVTYNWDFGDGAVSALQNPVHTYALPANYNTRLIVNTNHNCLDTALQAIVIYPDPIAAFTASTVCQSAPLTFTNTSSVPQGTITQYTWNFGDGSPTSSVQNPTHLYTNAGTYNVSLSILTNNGCSSNTTQVVTVNAKPNVSFTSQNVCLGNTTAFNNTSSISSGTISNWYWDFNNDGIIDNTSQSPSTNYATAGTYTVILNASSNNNCINSYSTSVTVHPVPNANFSANNVCQGGVTSFSNQSSIINGQISNFLWNFGNNSTSGQTSPTLIYANPGNYSVSLTAISNNNCSSVISHTVSVFANPIVGFNTPNLCLGATNLFTNTSSISSGTISNWVWDVNGDGNADSTSKNPTHIYPAPGFYTVSLSGISNNNCVSSYSSMIVIHPLPSVNFTVNNVCLGSPVTFTNQSSITNNNVIASYNWSFGNGTTSSATHPQTSYANYGNYPVTLTAVSNQNCISSNSSTVSVHPKPNINFSSTTTCFNQATQFNNTSTIPAGTIVKYKWDFDDNGTWEDSTANPSYIYPAPGSISCRLLGISNNGCVGFTVNPVIVHANPLASFKAPSTCLGDNTPFTNLSTSSDGAITTYLWDFNGDNVTDNVNMNPLHSYTTYGVYLTKLEVQTQYGCTHVISKSVYVNPKPVAQFTVKNNVGCPDLCTEFKNNSSIVKGSIVTHQWQFGDGTLPVYTTNPVHCYHSGVYSVILKVVSDSGCISTLNTPNIINAYPGPIADFNVTPDQVDINEPLVSVTSNASGATFTQYYLGDGSVYNKTNFTHSFNISEPQKIAIFQYVKNEYGCSDTAAKVIDIKPSYVIYIPNAFTPNADGLNDNFQAKGYGIHKFKMQIFDRWGHVIFESEDLNDAWDGTVRGSSEPIKNDVYVWKAQVEDVFHQNHQLNGHVTLMK